MLRSSHVSALGCGGVGWGVVGVVRECEGPGAGVRGQRGSQSVDSAVRGQQATGPPAARGECRDQGRSWGVLDWLVLSQG